MAVYVDNAFIKAQVGRIKARWCHLMADTPEELHEFAQRIGLRRSWAQHEDRPNLLHYDVTESVRAKAVRAGAKEITWRQAGEMVMERKKPKVKKWHRYKAGTIVTGRIGTLWVSQDHEGHPWCLHKSERSPEGIDTGYWQRATCLVDGFVTEPLSTEFWQEKADAKFIRKALILVRDDIEVLMEADVRLCELLRSLA